MGNCKDCKHWINGAPAWVPRDHKMCFRICSKALAEVKTMGSFGPCSVCGQSKSEGNSGPITEQERDRLRAAYAAVWHDGYKWGYDGDTGATNPYREGSEPAPQKLSPTLDRAGPEAVELVRLIRLADNAAWQIGEGFWCSNPELSQKHEAAESALRALRDAMSKRLRELVEKVTAP